MEINENCPEKFSNAVASKLQSYVYRLIDPRNGETFYVGKGKGNRVFSHINEELQFSKEEDELSTKLARIRSIRIAGFKVAHVIHRHGMDDKTATEVEAALIDAYPGLSNRIGGIGSYDFGIMHATEIIHRYSVKQADFKHKALLININWSATKTDFYEATRFAWKINKLKAKKAEVILATVQGLIVDAFEADKWLDATVINFPGREDIPGRSGFIGHPASDDKKELYVNKRVPDVYRKRGAANPIRYTW